MSIIKQEVSKEYESLAAYKNTSAQDVKDLFDEVRHWRERAEKAEAKLVAIKLQLTSYQPPVAINSLIKQICES